jgi:hypothetical protein
MPSEYAQSQYARGYKNVGFSLYVLIAGIICLLFYFLIGISLIVIGIMIFQLENKIINKLYLQLKHIERIQHFYSL